MSTNTVTPWELVFSVDLGGAQFCLCITRVGVVIMFMDNLRGDDVLAELLTHQLTGTSGHTFVPGVSCRTLGKAGLILHIYVHA